MSRTQFILGRRQTRVEMPNELIGGKTTSGFGMIGGGGNLGTGTKYNFAGQPLVGFNGKPTGYPDSPSGGINFNDLVWNNPPDPVFFFPDGVGCTANLTNSQNHGSLEVITIDAKFCSADNLSNLTFIGPDQACVLTVNLISLVEHTSGTFPTKGGIFIQDGLNNIIFEFDMDITTPLGVSVNPFTVPTGFTNPLTVVYVAESVENSGSINFTFSLTPAF